MMQEQVTMRDMMVHVSVSTLIYISSLKNYFFFFTISVHVVCAHKCTVLSEAGRGCWIL